jgi:hypothetical protein
VILIKNGLFLIKNGLFLIKNGLFLIKNGLFLIKNTLFLIKNTLFLIKNTLFLIKNDMVLITNTLFLIKNEAAAAGTGAVPDRAGGDSPDPVCTFPPPTPILTREGMKKQGPETPGYRQIRERTWDEDTRAVLLAGDPQDAAVSVIVSGDKLEMRADLYPPGAEGSPLNPEGIRAALDRINVIHGLLWENIRRAAAVCNLNRRILRNVPIARGDPPVTEVLEYFQLNPNLKPPAAETGGGGRIDYRTRSPFIIVKRGQALAKQKSPRAGRTGRDIYGEEIPHDTIRPQGVSPGENTRSEGRYIYAAINGQLVIRQGVLDVQNSLVIKGAVDYRTGHIIFPGDIFIAGPVSDGFKIYSGGSLTVKQTLDLTDVITRTDLTVSGGIIGRGKAVMKVGGNLSARFIENCRAACRKTVRVESAIVNSSIYTMETLEMGDKGRILGGEIYALRGVRAGGIGKESGRPTRIHCGVDFTALQEQEKYGRRMRIILGQMMRLKQRAAEEAGRGAGSGGGAPGGGGPAPLEEALARLEEERKQTGDRIAAASGRINPGEDAVVEVRGEIAPGTLIEICQIALFVPEPIKHSRIRLDTSRGRLVTEPL